MKRIYLLLLLTLLLAGCAVTPAKNQPIESTFEIAELDTAVIAEPETQPLQATALETQATETVLPTTEAPDPLEALLENMTIEEQVGQLFLARCPDTNAAQDISIYHLGGYILFGRDFKGQTPDSLRQTLASYQEAAKIPLLIAVDEEGGTVCRVSSNAAFRKKRFPSPRSLYELGGIELAVGTEGEKCQLLSDLGINVNMAPVCDVTTDPNAFMYRRSLGQNPKIISDYIQQTVIAMDAYKIGSVLKHFPGYGNNDDTHVGIAIDTRELTELENGDLLPFQAGIDAGCGAVLVSHTIVNSLDMQFPASLSPAVHQYLREEMGFDGVIVTDDLIMEAITDLYGTGEAAVLAVLAGNDLLCSSDYQTQYSAVLDAVNSGRISEETLREAVLRVLRWKDALGLLE